MSQTYSINIHRLQADLQNLAKIGFDHETKGVNRIGFSRADYEGRLWLMKQFKALGLEPYMDGAANVICRLGDPDKPAVIMGSHTDSVPDGGMFDGALGVLCGLEVMRVIKEHSIDLTYPIEVVSFSEEEGRFGGMFGVQSFCGQIDPAWITSVQDTNGIYLKDEMQALGLEPLDALKACRAPETVKAYLEVHIEQGPVLEEMNCPIGVVEGITGVFDWSVCLIGEANHSGTTPMDKRRDAFMGLTKFAQQIPRIIEDHGSDISRITIGKVDVLPGFTHIVPGEVQFSLCVRDLDEGIMQNLAQACREVLSSIARQDNLMFEYEEKSWLSPKHCDPEIVKLLGDQAKKLGYQCNFMPSGAGHDAQFMTDLTKTGMIFVPSIGGISHSPKELTKWPDIEKGANLLLQACLSLAA